MPHGAFDVDDRRRTEETLFTAVGFLGDSSMKADDGGHGYDARRLGRHNVAYDAANFVLGIFCVSVVELAFGGLRRDGQKDWR